MNFEDEVALEPISLTTTAMKLKVHPVILAGGSRTRLWPMSSERSPKSLVELVVNDSPLQATARQLVSLAGQVPLASRLLVVTRDDCGFECAEQIRALGKRCRLLLEPAGRGTASAVTAAALSIVADDGDGIMVVSPVDHAVPDAEAFHAAVHCGVRQATTGSDADAPYRHGGLVVLRASAWLAALRRREPAVYDACKAAYDNCAREGAFFRLERSAFERAPVGAIEDILAPRAEGGDEARPRRKVHRPWGHYDSVDVGERFQVKRIVVKPGAQLSLQKHRYRSEHWVVVRGTALVTRDDERFVVCANQSAYIPLGAVHRLENPGDAPLEVIEVQCGAYLGEDDIVRLEDAYGRR